MFDPDSIPDSIPENWDPDEEDSIKELPDKPELTFEELDRLADGLDFELVKAPVHMVLPKGLLIDLLNGAPDEFPIGDLLNVLTNMVFDVSGAIPGPISKKIKSGKIPQPPGWCGGCHKQMLICDCD